MMYNNTFAYSQLDLLSNIILIGMPETGHDDSQMPQMLKQYFLSGMYIESTVQFLLISIYRLYIYKL